MKRIGIITLYRGYNYGTSLQAYALREYIASLGYEAQILWTDENTTAGRDIRLSKIFRMGWRSITRPKLFLKMVRGYYNSFKKPISAETKEKFIEFTVNELHVQGMKYMQLIDFANHTSTAAMVCGSDQIWSAWSANIDPIYYLRFAPKDKRVAYAPSFGSNEIPACNRDIIREYIRDIPHLSTRELHGVQIIKELTGREASIVLDPTLLIDWNQWRAAPANAPYIVTYFLDEPSPYAISCLKQLIATFNCNVIAFPYRHKAWTLMEDTIKFVDIGPKQFIEIMSNAKFVCTDSFHGTAFSLNFNIPFLTFQRNYKTAAGQEVRLLSLLEQVGLTQRYVSLEIDISNMQEIDFSFVNNRIAEMRDLSKAFLCDSLHTQQNT